MKKVLTGVMVGLIGAGSIFLFYFFRGAYAEAVFPENTVAFVSLHNVEEARKSAETTLLWKQISHSPRKEIYDRQVERLYRAIESSVGFDPRPLLHQFTRDLAFGVFPLGNATLGMAFVGYVKSESDTGEFFERNIDPALKRRFPDLSKSSIEYQSFNYYKYSSTQFRRDLSPCYLVTDDHLFFAVSEGSLRSLLDVRRERAHSISTNDLFAEAKRKLDYRRGLLGFVNFPEVLQVGKGRLGGEGKGFWPALVRVTGAEGLRYFSYTVRVKGEGFVEAGVLAVDPEPQGLLKIYLEQPVSELEGMKTIPAAAHIAGSSTLADLAQMWDEVNHQLQELLTPEQYRNWEQGLAAVRALLDFDVRRDLLEPIGNEFLFSYQVEESTWPEWGGMKYLVAMQLRKADRFQQTIDRVTGLASLRGLLKEEENYHGKQIQKFRIESEPHSFSPAYYIENSWFHFASDAAWLKESIDAKLNNRSVTSLVDYDKVTADFPRKVNSLSYTNIQSYLQTYSYILQREATEPESRWIREYGVQEELADLARGLFGAASYTRVQKNGIQFYSYSSVPSSFLSLPPVLFALSVVGQRYESRLPINW